MSSVQLNFCLEPGRGCFWSEPGRGCFWSEPGIGCFWSDPERKICGTVCSCTIGKLSCISQAAAGGSPHPVPAPHVTVTCVHRVPIALLPLRDNLNPAPPPE